MTLYLALSRFLSLSLFLALRLSPGWDGPTPRHDPYSSHFTSTIPPCAASPPLSIYENSTPLLTLRHHCAFATVPQYSLGLGALARGLGAGATGGRLSAALLPRRSVYMVALREGAASLPSFFARRRVGIRRVRGFGIPRRFAAPRSTAALAPALHRCVAIDISAASKLLPLRRSLFALKNRESRRNEDKEKREKKGEKESLRLVQFFRSSKAKEFFYTGYLVPVAY